MTKNTTKEETLAESAIALLSAMIETPSLSREEEKTAALIESLLQRNHIPTKRMANNVLAFNKHFDPYCCLIK